VARSTPYDCIASSYAMASISAAEDRICMGTK
jgi:cathepsin B